MVMARMSKEERLEIVGGIATSMASFIAEIDSSSIRVARYIRQRLELLADFMSEGPLRDIAADGRKLKAITCWCGSAAEDLNEGVLGRSWCHAHVPRCRSGAHLHGQCLCTGGQ